MKSHLKIRIRSTPARLSQQISKGFWHAHRHVHDGVQVHDQNMNQASLVAMSINMAMPTAIQKHRSMARL